MSPTFFFVLSQLCRTEQREEEKKDACEKSEKESNAKESLQQILLLLSFLKQHLA
jgi:hypothetical protein